MRLGGGGGSIKASDDGEGRFVRVEVVATGGGEAVIAEMVKISLGSEL
jgi:hypothetical protein